MQGWSSTAARPQAKPRIRARGDGNCDASTLAAGFAIAFLRRCRRRACPHGSRDWVQLQRERRAERPRLARGQASGARFERLFVARQSMAVQVRKHVISRPPTSVALASRISAADAAPVACLLPCIFHHSARWQSIIPSSLPSSTLGTPSVLF